MVGFDGQWHDRNERRLKRIEDQNKEILELLRGLKRGEERIMSQQDDINTLAQQEEQDIASIQASQASYAASAAAMKQQIDTLVQQQQQNPTAQLDLTGAQQAANDLHNAAQALASAATTEASDASGGTTTPTDPTGGGTTTDPTGGGTTTDPTGGGGTVTPPDNTGGGTTAATTPDQPVYTYTGQGTPADPAWTAAPFLTSDGQQLYYFASDSPGSAANGNGLGGVWAAYDATQGVQPAPTDAPTNEPSPPTS